MRSWAGQIIRTVAVAAFLFQPASAEDTVTRDPPTTTGKTVEVVGHNLEPLIMVTLPRPRFPKEAKGVSGWVRIECVVTPKGRVRNVRVVESQPAGVFDQAAIDAMKPVRFKPFKSKEPRLMTQRLIFSAD
jgi:protein TonB